MLNQAPVRNRKRNGKKNRRLHTVLRFNKPSPKSPEEHSQILKGTYKW